jgi:hypothetical protein
VQHPHIIGIRDQAFADPENERRPFFVLEYFPGVSLEAYRQQNGPLPGAELLPLAQAVASAVHAAHQAGILHRDLKPANILVRRTEAGWGVRVIDFGLAVRHSSAVQASLAAASERKTQRERSFAGTLRYAAPEQKGELPGAKPGPHSDVYAFGKTCLELLFGHTEVLTEDWADQPEPWRGRWEKLLTACVRVRLDGPRRRLPGFAAVLEELAGWGATPAEIPVLPVEPVTRPSGTSSQQPAAPVVPAPRENPPSLEDAVTAERTFQELERRMSGNLARWQASPAPLEWVKANQGRWDHARFQGLLGELRQGRFWPMKEAEVGRVVEEARARWLAEQVPPVAQRKPGDRLTLKIPAWEPAAPPGNLPRILTVSVPAWEPASPPNGQPRLLALRWRSVP